LLAEADGGLWIGTSRGLKQFRRGSIADHSALEIGMPTVRIFIMWFAASAIALQRGDGFLFQTLASKRRGSPCSDDREAIA
jgi:hypothetical protein